MKIIKLSAIASTNSFLKEMAQNNELADFTVVTVDEQTRGKGQHGNSWFSSPKKSLTFSVFVRFTNLQITNNVLLNFAVSLAIFECLQKLNTPKVSIKWPNDIMSANKKLCGVLIEPNLQRGFIKSAIIGIGLNVNETSFPLHLPNATSLQIIHHKEFYLDELLNTLLLKLESKIKILRENKFEVLERNYFNNLYKKDVVATFLDQEKKPFVGIIKGVSKNGKLQILLENEVLHEYGIKEITFI
ncbi:biotin--[acetyl-CoA-carboxylase] ligase [Polaribacter sp.]|nr:biotin--[acetyl-CoA-carboxylase] ligase [Polaribacter sp.]